MPSETHASHKDLKSSTKTIRIGLVGCGRISRNHIYAIASLHERAQLVAICDSQIDSLCNAEELIVNAARENNVKPLPPLRFTSYEKLIYSVEKGDLILDLIVLTTPSGLHSIQAIEAARVGLNVCTEKPMATTWEDGLAMLKACDQAGVKLFVVLQNRFNSTLQLVRRQIQSGRFGQLVMVTVNVFWHRPQQYYDQANWRGTWKYDGGALMNQASHYVDLLAWLIGPLDSISAQTGTLGRNIEAEDTAALHMRWCNGALGTMAVTMLTYPKNLEGSITILGDKGTVKIGGTAVNKIEHWEFSDKHADDQLIDQASYDTTSVYGFGHIPYYNHLIDYLDGEPSQISDGFEGLKSLELLVASYQSSKDESLVHLPLNRQIN